MAIAKANRTREKKKLWMGEIKNGTAEAKDSWVPKRNLFVFKLKMRGTCDIRKIGKPMGSFQTQARRYYDPFSRPFYCDLKVFKKLTKFLHKNLSFFLVEFRKMICRKKDWNLLKKLARLAGDQSFRGRPRNRPNRLIKFCVRPG